METSTAPRMEAPAAAYALAEVAPQVLRRVSAEARSSPRCASPSEHPFSFASSAVVKADWQVEVLREKDADPEAPKPPKRLPSRPRSSLHRPR
jgi:hypothetical protein